MLYEKMRLAPLPYKRTWRLRKKRWYLLPQRWTFRRSMSFVSYEGNVHAYRHRNYWLIYQYNFSWLFIDMSWELNLEGEFLSESVVRHEPLKYATPSGDIYGANC
jgi:hypothetical protein